MHIRTARLVLRPLVMSDAYRIAMLAGDFDVASMTGTIPHPYSERMAAEWIKGALAGKEGVVFAIERFGALIGCAGYRAKDGTFAELGYWIGKPFWGNGYATEAAQALIEHAFAQNGFAFVVAGHFRDNPASARVIAKLGFVQQDEVARECAARGDQTLCVLYRLDRGRAPGHTASP
jgi:[ribosomal protein S5]-alanine N-acetyltransferase